MTAGLKHIMRLLSLLPIIQESRENGHFWNGHYSYPTQILINEQQTPFCTKSSPKKPKAYSFYVAPVSCDLAQPSLSEQAADNIQSVCSSVGNQRLSICFTKKQTGNIQN